MSRKQIDCFEINKKFWKFLGLWAEENSSIYYKYYQIIFFILIFITFNVLFTINLCFLPRHLDLFIEEILFYFAELAVLAKVLTFVYMRDVLEDIVRTLQCDIFQPKTDNGLKIVQSAKKLIRKLYKIMAGVSHTSSIMLIISPLIAHTFYSVALDLPVCSYSFIPDNVKKIIFYPLYLYQSLGIHFYMLVNVNTDTFLWGLLILVIAQLEVLDRNLRRMADYDESAQDASNKEQVFQLRLNKCILHFSEIYRFCSMIEAVFSVVLFVQFSTSSCIICVSLFRFTLPASNSYYIFLTTYIISMMIKIMMPCWFGTRVTDASSKLSIAIYNCDWTPRSRKFKTSLILFVERMNRPLSVTGLKMFPLLLTTFTKIMNTAYSFYTLLRHVEK